MKEKKEEAEILNIHAWIIISKRLIYKFKFSYAQSTRLEHIAYYSYMYAEPMDTIVSRQWIVKFTRKISSLLIKYTILCPMCTTSWPVN